MSIGCLACDRRYSVGLNGLGDIYSVNDAGDPVDFGSSGPNDWVNPYPASTLPQPIAGPSNSINWNNLLSVFANTGSKIALATTGSNPSYQQVGPGGSTTVYGNPTSANVSSFLPSLGSGMGIGTIAMLGIGLVVLVGVMKK